MFKPLGKVKASKLQENHYVIHNDDIWRVVNNIRITGNKQAVILAYHTWTDPKWYELATLRDEDQVVTFVKID